MLFQRWSPALLSRPMVQKHAGGILQYVQHFVFYADSRTAAVALNRQEQEQEQGLPTHPPFPSYGSNKASPSMQACTCICTAERRQWWVGRTAYAKLSRPYSAENTGLEKANHNPAICAPWTTRAPTAGVFHYKQT